MTEIGNRSASRENEGPIIKALVSQDKKRLREDRGREMEEGAGE